MFSACLSTGIRCIMFVFLIMLLNLFTTMTSNDGRRIIRRKKKKKCNTNNIISVCACIRIQRTRLYGAPNYCRTSGLLFYFFDFFFFYVLLFLLVTVTDDCGPYTSRALSIDRRPHSARCARPRHRCRRIF